MIEALLRAGHEVVARHASETAVPTAPPLRSSPLCSTEDVAGVGDVM
jgi:hypothetical protein